MTKGMTRSRVRYEKHCKHCSTAFSVPEYRKNTAAYCSRRCTALASRQQMESTCAVCSAKFTHIASRANKAKYCSPACYGKAMSQKGTAQYECAHCGVTFLDAPSHKRKYCSRQCVNKAKKEFWSPAFTTVRKAMVRRGAVKKCERCGYDAHPEILGVHHKDRNNRNNAPNNLEVLCPICHSLEHRKHIAHGSKE